VGWNDWQLPLSNTGVKYFTLQVATASQLCLSTPQIGAHDTRHFFSLRNQGFEAVFPNHKVYLKLLDVRPLPN
jgi:hypothetical protein